MALLVQEWSPLIVAVFSSVVLMWILSVLSGATAFLAVLNGYYHFIHRGSSD